MSCSERLGARRHVTIPQGRIELRERGPQDGIPLVFVHGGLANGDLWRDVVPPLARTGRYRCITPDWPLGSHAEPLRAGADVTPPGQAEIVVAVLDALDLDRVVLVANDAGGAISQLVLARHPDRVDRVVLTSCDNHRAFPPRYLKPVRWLTFVPGLAHPIARLFGWGPVRRIFFWSVASRPLPPEITSSYLDPMRRSRAVRDELVRFFRDVRPAHTTGALPGLRRFPRPALVVWGGQDWWFSRGGGRRLAATLPDARFLVLDGARTFVPEDAPAELARLVDGFLRETAPDGEDVPAAPTAVPTG
jgi:pimeloyl-ACP methyl ester carboxylesterase